MRGALLIVGLCCASTASADPRKQVTQPAQDRSLSGRLRNVVLTDPSGARLASRVVTRLCALRKVVARTLDPIRPRRVSVEVTLGARTAIPGAEHLPLVSDAPILVNAGAFGKLFVPSQQLRKKELASGEATPRINYGVSVGSPVGGLGASKLDGASIGFRFLPLVKVKIGQRSKLVAFSVSSLAGFSFGRYDKGKAADRGPFASVSLPVPNVLPGVWGTVGLTFYADGLKKPVDRAFAKISKWFKQDGSKPTDKAVKTPR